MKSFIILILIVFPLLAIAQSEDLVKDYTNAYTGYNTLVQSSSATFGFVPYSSGGIYGAPTGDSVSLMITHTSGTAAFATNGYDPGNAVDIGNQATSGDNTYHFDLVFSRLVDFTMDIGGSLGASTRPGYEGTSYVGGFSVLPSGVIIRDVSGFPSTDGIPDLIWNGSQLTGATGNVGPGLYEDPDIRASGTLEWDDISHVSFDYVIDDQSAFGFSTGGFSIGRFSIASVPEPGSAWLLGTATAMLGLRRRRKEMVKK